MIQKRPQKPRVRNPEETRAMLLQATIDLVAEKGADAVSVQEAARRANLSRGIAYHHFNDRDQLLREAKKWVSDRLQDGVRQLNGATLHDRVHYTTRFVLENPDACKLMIADALAGRDLDRRHPFVSLVMKMLKQLKARGLARANLDMEVVTYVTFGTIATILMLREQHKGEDMNALAERYTNEWISMLGSGIFAKGVDVDAITRTVALPSSRRAKTTRKRAPT